MSAVALNVRVAVLAALVGGLFGAAAEASTRGGVLLTPGHLAPQARAQLLTDIEVAKTAHPETFEALRQIRAELPQLDAQKRGRLVPLTPALKALGVEAVPALLHELAVDAEPRGDLTDDAWLAWRTGVVEALERRRG